MKKLYKILSLLIVPSILILYSYSGGSPGGKTGSPGDGNANCTQCHDDGTPLPQEGWITTDIPEDGYMPGETYTITTTGTFPGVGKMGFELTAENFTGDKLPDFTITDANRTKFTNNDNAVTHTQAGNVPDGNTNTWSVDWTAPTEEDNVFFYAAVNAANGNGNNQGDQIFLTSLTVSKYVPAPAVVSVDPDHAEQNSDLTVTITGENTTWQSGVSTVTFKYHDDDQITFDGTNIDVKSDTELTADISITLDQMTGLYDVSVDALTLENGFTVDVVSSIGADHLANSINVYPNPGSEYTMIDLPEAAQIKIVDLAGRLLFSIDHTGRHEKIDVSTYEPGIYFIRISYEGNTVTKRLLKK